MCIIVYIFSCVIGYWLTSRSKMLVYVAVYKDTLGYLSYYVKVEALIRILCVCVMTAFHTLSFIS